MTFPPKAPRSLDGHVAIVTGAGTRPGALFPKIGVGAACALTLAEAGAKVAVVDIDASAIERTLAWAAETRPNLVDVVADVRVEGDCKRAVDATVERFGAPSVLVNSVGVLGAPGTVVDADLQAWHSVLDVNLTSVVLMCKYTLPPMIANGGGSVVNVSSIGAIRGFGSTGYAASKGGMISLTTSMAYAHGRDGIRFNTVLPGHVATPMGGAGGAQDQVRVDANMLGTEGTAWDVAGAVAFLSSDAARWITAAALPVDGGASMVTGLGLHSLMSDGREKQ
jgi:NAD(P)-dependent dehydrogenase (short-subunit alcohol dehydrogenase family)